MSVSTAARSGQGARIRQQDLYLKRTAPGVKVFFVTLGGIYRMEVTNKMNRLKTTLLLTCLTLLMVALGSAIGSKACMVFAFLMASAHLFIVNPLTGGGLLSLSSTHLPMEERIARLESMNMNGSMK